MKKQFIFIIILIISPLLTFAITEPKGALKHEISNSEKRDSNKEDPANLITCVTKTGTATTPEGVTVEISATGCSHDPLRANIMAVIGLAMAKRIAEA